MTENIPKEQLSEWLADPTTKKVLSVLRGVRQSHIDLLMNGGSLDLDSSEKTALRTSHILGKIAGMNLLIELNVEED